MRNPSSTRIGWLSFAAACLSFCAVFVRPASGQVCPITFPPPPANNLTAYVTAYPTGISSVFAVEVTNITNGVAYPNPPIPYGVYPTWCIDDVDGITPANFTIPGTLYSGVVYSTCDPNLNIELPPGHPNTLVSPAVWQMVNYLLNHQTYAGTNVFYWEMQAAINTLVGSGAGYIDWATGIPIPANEPIPNGEGGYPTYDPNVVQAMLAAASINAPNWVPQCGDVYGVIFVPYPTTNQFILLEVPVPCSESISVTKQIACLQPGDTHTALGNTAAGFVGTNDPAFYYQITIANTGNIPLTNLTVLDSLLGNQTAQFVPAPDTVYSPTNVLLPGSNVVANFKMSFPANATNVVTVVADASLMNTVTNPFTTPPTIITNAEPVTGTSQAVALVDSASIFCSLSVSSHQDLNSPPVPGTVLLPSSASPTPTVSFALTVVNTGAATLNNITITSSYLTGLGCNMPASFSLARGATQIFPLCSEQIPCPGVSGFTVNIAGQAGADGAHCAVYDTNGNPIGVSCSSMGSVFYEGSVSGNIYLDCDGHAPVSGTDKGLAGVTVVLYTNSSPTPTQVATTNTDVNGYYIFNNLPPGTYSVQVTPPSNYTQSYASANGPMAVSCNSGEVFGLEDNTPVTLNVQPGVSYPCNPSPATLANARFLVTNGIHASDDRSTSLPFTVTDMTTTTGCLVQDVFTITATGTCGQTATAHVTNSWTLDNTTPAMSGVPTGGNLGCNPAANTLPTVASITALVSAADTCTTPTVLVASKLSNNGCFYTNIFTITATNSCSSNSAVATVIYTWTQDNTSPALVGVPAGGSLGCNPAANTLPTVASITALVSATDTCTTPTLLVTSKLINSGCFFTNTFTITATNSCSGNTAVATVIYTWTQDNTTPALTGVPTGGNLGCNPAAGTLPTVGSITALVKATDTCTTPTVLVASKLTNNGCFYTNIFTITATNSCSSNSTVATVIYTWTQDNTTPVLTGVPTGGNLGCNPAANTLPTVASIRGLVSATDTCTTPTLLVTSKTTSSGCFYTNTLTITATNSCSSNSAVATVTYTWTQDSTTPTLTGVPAGGNLGCNPASNSLPTVASIRGLVSATDTCSTPTLLVTSKITNSGCFYTNTFTITATNSCSSNSAVATVVYSWTQDNTTPTLTGVPTGGGLGVNPASNTLPTVASITALVKATDTCTTPTLLVTNKFTTNGCIISNIFTITAKDSCSGNSAVATVAYYWTVDTIVPILTGVPAGGYLGTNPPVVPTDLSVSNLLHTTDACCLVTLSVSHVDVTNICLITRTFTITATDSCDGNHVTATVVYTWTTDAGPVVSCPPNVTIATNFSPIYCTFSPNDWNSSCNGPGTTPTWWVNWDQQNHGYNCLISWTNWWTACNGSNPGSNFWNFCQNPQSGNPSRGSWWGNAQNQNSAPTWCASYNYGNPNENWWVPCNGFNPGSVLTNCFGSIYSNGCVQVGLPGGNCVKLTSPSAVRQCLGFSGTPGVLTSSATNPNSCSAGSFCAQVLALQLNCDFGDAGAQSGFGGPCGDLVLNDSTSPCNGWKVRDVLKTAHCVLGGGSAPSGCTPGYLSGLCSNINQCFEGCQVSSWCRNHLTPVCVPPPCVTGTATVTTGACITNVVLTYCDTVTNGSCPGVYVITRKWLAVDAAGMSNYCNQTITINPFPGPGISGKIDNDSDGTGGSSGNNWGWNNWGWNNWGWNSTPDFSSDAGLTGVTVTLKNSSGAVVGTTVSDTNGNFTFANPGAGTFTVVVTPPAGYSPTYQTSGVSNQTTVTISNQCQIVCNLIFAYMGNQTGVKLIKTGPASAACGSNITYSFAVTNTGNNCVALTVIDPLLGGQIFSQSSVAPGQGFTFTKNYTITTVTNLTNTAWAVADPALGPNVTNSSTAITTVTTKPQTCSIYCNFNSQMPSSGWIWCNSHISANSGGPCDIHCSGATITITGQSGKVYTFPVPDCDVIFSATCTVGSSSFDGTKWTTTLPTGGDDEIFLSGCAIPANPDYASAKNVLWQGNFTCTTPKTSFNWQWGAACYNNTTPSYSSLGVKACHQTPCGYSSNSGDHAGTPENQKSHCTGGGTGGGGSNWTGSWSSTGSCTPPSCY